jgi:hypothetical protein
MSGVKSTPDATVTPHHEYDEKPAQAGWTTRKKAIIGGVVAFIVILGVALGAGLGVGLKKNGDSSSASGSGGGGGSGNGSSPTGTAPGTFATGLYAPPLSCPQSQGAPYNQIYKWPIGASSAFNKTLSPFNATDPAVNFTLVGDPTFKLPPQINTTLDDANETVVFNFSSYEQDAATGVFGITATVANGSSFTLYSNGYFRFYPANCNSSLGYHIDLTKFTDGNFKNTTTALAARGELTNLQSRADKVDTSAPFSVQFHANDACGKPVTGLTPKLECQVQITSGFPIQPLGIPFSNTATADFFDHGDGFYSGTCRTPDTTPMKDLCIKGIDKACSWAAGFSHKAACDEVGVQIGAAIGGDIAAIIGIELGPLDILVYVEGAYLGGKAAQWLCDKAFGKLEDKICADVLNKPLEPFCQDLTKAEVVGVRAAGLPNGKIEVMPSVSAVQPGKTVQASVVATRTVNVPAGASCTAGGGPLCNIDTYSNSGIFGTGPDFGTDAWRQCKFCCAEWAESEYGGACGCCLFEFQYEDPSNNCCSLGYFNKCCKVDC